MVKGHVAFARDAHYDSQHRTLAVSMKPAVGKELFPLANNSLSAVVDSGNSFKGQFETERFIFGKIRGYTLRTMTHLNSNTSSTFAGHNVSHLSEIAQFRMMAENVPIHHLQGLDILSMPKGIREYVVAQLLHDHGAGVVSAFRGVSVDQVDSNSSKRPNLQSKNLFVSEFLSSLLRFLSVALAVNSRRSVDCKYGKSNIHLLLVKVLREQSGKIDLTASDLDLNGCSRVHLDTMKESGFGTAPIWYQQSVATGPPHQ